MKLVKRREIKKEETYNLHVQDNHNYFVEGAMVSNCHTLKGDVLKKLMTEYFQNVPIRWGLTGTIPKDPLDAIQLEISVGKCNLRVETKELQDKGFLADAEISVLQLKDDRKFLDYQTELAEILNDEDRIRYIANFVKEISQVGNTLILIDRIEPGTNLTEHIRALGLDVEFIHGGVKNANRKERYKDVQAGDKTVTVATFGVAAVGIDIQRLHNLVLIEPGKAFTRVMQSLGRGLRRGSDKEKIYAYDICTTTKYSNKHKNERLKYYREKQQKHTVYKISDWREYE